MRFKFEKGVHGRATRLCVTAVYHDDERVLSYLQKLADWSEAADEPLRIGFGPASEPAPSWELTVNLVEGRATGTCGPGAP